MLLPCFFVALITPEMVPERFSGVETVLQRARGIIAAQRLEGASLIGLGHSFGGALTLHRELELYQKAGFTAPEILARATFEAKVAV